MTRAAPRRGHRLTCLHPAKQLQHSTIGVLEADDTNLFFTKGRSGVSRKANVSRGNVVVLFLAYGNGGNNNFKGVATLYGSGTCSYGSALAWATLTTLAGSLWLARGLIESFKGKGLHRPDLCCKQTAASPWFGPGR